MFQTTFIALGMMALLLTILGTLGDRFDATTLTIFSLLSAILWSVWGLQAQNVERASGGVVVVESYQSLTAIGLLFAAVMVFSMLQRLLTTYNEINEERSNVVG